MYLSYDLLTHYVFFNFKAIGRAEINSTLLLEKLFVYVQSLNGVETFPEYQYIKPQIVTSA